jgi:branched-chain amino acid transport system ATP-binding protein
MGRETHLDGSQQDHAAVSHAADSGGSDHAAAAGGVPQALLRCQDVRVRFGGIVALDGVSLEVASGQIVGVIGPNGAGKTTLFNCISRLYDVNSGEISFAGASLLGAPRHRVAGLGIARTFQNVALFESLSVEDNVLVGTHPQRQAGFLRDALSGGVRADSLAHAQRAAELIELLELSADRQRPVRDLPFGTRKRVELARALASRPRLLMLDEPAGGLSHSDVDQLRELIDALRERYALTVLLVEHHMQFVMRLCDRVVALDFGRRIAEGTPAEIQSHPEVIRAYLGGAA